MATSNPFGDPATVGLFGLAQGLLAAGNPSPMPVSVGGALSQGFGGALNSAMNATKLNQQQTLIDLEKLKAAQLQRQLGLQAWALGAGPMPDMGGGTGVSPTTPSAVAGMGGGSGVTQQAQSPLMQTGFTQQAPQATPSPGGMPALPANSPLAGLPPEAQNAIRLNLGLPGAGNIAWQATQPIIGREGGIYRRTPNGGMELDPAWLAGEQKRLELQKGIEDQHTLIDVPLANGQSRKMTKAQALNLTANTNQIVNAVPGLDKEAVANIQSQLAAEPDKPINIDLNIGGRQAKLTLAPLGGMPGFTAGQPTEARAAQEKSGTEAGGVQTQIDQEASSALQSRRILNEMRSLSQDFTTGKVAPFKRALGEWAQALSLPGNWTEEIKAAESQQALQKLTAQMATAAMKQFTNRGTQMEFKTFLQNNPNAELTPGGFQKVLEFMDQTSQQALDKQQAYQEWRKRNPVERSQDFLAEWNKRKNAELSAAPSAGPKPLPTKGQVVDGWEYVGGDPANRMSWRKK